MNVTDLVILGVLALFAFTGWRSGLVSNVFAGVGLIGGFLVGTHLVPRLYKAGSQDPIVALSAMGLVLGCALVGSNVLSFIGRRIPRPPGVLRRVDSVLGLSFSVVVAAMASWAVGYAITAAPALSVTQDVRDSRVLATIDRVMPESATQVLAGMTNTITTDVFPRYLDPFESEPVVPVDAPDPKTAEAAGVRAAAKSTARVHGTDRCDTIVTGTGFVYAPERVMTNAHVVRGVSHPEVTIGKKTWKASTVVYDPRLDVAVLLVPGLKAKALDFAPAPRSGNAAAVLGHPEGGPLTIEPARVRGVMTLRSPDINQQGRVEREVISLRTTIVQGNSGGPVVTTGGDVLGLVFAASQSDPDTGYAMTALQVAGAAKRGIQAITAVPTGECH